MSDPNLEPPQLSIDLVVWLGQYVPHHTPHPTQDTLADLMFNGGRRSLVEELLEIYKSQQGALSEGVPPEVAQDPEPGQVGPLAHLGIYEE